MLKQLSMKLSCASCELGPGLDIAIPTEDQGLEIAMCGEINLGNDTSYNDQACKCLLLALTCVMQELFTAGLASIALATCASVRWEPRVLRMLASSGSSSSLVMSDWVYRVCPSSSQ